MEELLTSFKNPVEEVFFLINEIPVAVVAVISMVFVTNTMLRYLNKRTNHTEISNKRIRNLSEEVENLKRLSLAIPEKDIHELKLNIVQKIKEEASIDLLKSLEETASKNSSEFSQIKAIEQYGKSIRQRLAQEIFSLERRGNLNLVLGVVLASIGLATLSYFVLAKRPLGDTTEVTLFLGGRIVLVVTFQVFSFFFLNLYKSTLREIKFFHNELTTMEMRLATLSLSESIDSSENRFELLRDLAKMERNFVLEKGQTTLSLEREKNDSTENRDLLEKLIAVIGGEARK